MATGKTHSKYVTIVYNSQTVTCRINNLPGVGIAYDEEDITAFCDAIHMYVLGQGNVDMSVSGPFDNTATSGSHAVFEALNGNQAGATMVISYGIRAAPTSGDPKFTVTALGVTSYTVDATGGAVTWNSTLKPMTGATAAWGTV